MKYKIYFEFESMYKTIYRLLIGGRLLPVLASQYIMISMFDKVSSSEILSEE